MRVTTSFLEPRMGFLKELLWEEMPSLELRLQIMCSDSNRFPRLK